MNNPPNSPLKTPSSDDGEKYHVAYLVKKEWHIHPVEDDIELVILCDLLIRMGRDFRVKRLADEKIGKVKNWNDFCFLLNLFSIGLTDRNALRHGAECPNEE